MTDKLERPSRHDIDYPHHCSNIAMIISNTESLREVEPRVREYLLTVGVVTT